MDIKPFRNKADYEAALKEVEQLWGTEPGTPEGDWFEVLFTLVEAYEDQHYPILPPDPIEACVGFYESDFVKSLCHTQVNLNGLSTGRFWKSLSPGYERIMSRSQPGERKISACL